MKLPDGESATALPRTGWILHDGGCGFCFRWVHFWKNVVERRGFALKDLQSAFDDGSLLVALQNGFDEGLHRFYPRLTARVDLSLPRNRISQCFPYHASVDPKLPGHSFDRSHPVLVLPSNLFE